MHLARRIQPTTPSPCPALMASRHWRALARRAMNEGNTAGALHCWLQVRDAEPRAMDTLFHIACCQAVLGDRERACYLFHELADREQTPPALRHRAAQLAALLASPGPGLYTTH